MPLPPPRVATMRLAPELASARSARHFMAAVLRAQGRSELADDACLCATELVTNAVLHARTTIEVRIDTNQRGVRIEVGDDSARLTSFPVPVPPEPDVLAGGELDEDRSGTLLGEEGMTGRGLLVVATLADDWGSHIDGDGKLVWFQLGAGGAGVPTPPEPLAFATRAPSPAARLHRGSGPDAGLVHVCVLDVPVRLLLAADDYLDDLIREFQLLALDQASAATAELPAQLLDVVESILERYADAHLARKEETRAAARRGETHIAIELRLPPEAAAAAQQLDELLDRADDYCRSGELLNLAADDEVAAFRRWYLAEIAAQLEGADPTSPNPFPQ